MATSERWVELVREKYLADRTLGKLYVWEGPVRIFSSEALELPWKKNANRTSCVVAGEYPLVLEYSPAFKKDLWELKLVPARSEAKVHGANFVKQLLGCIAPGLKLADLDKDGKMDVASSGAALAKFHEALKGLAKTRIVIRGDGRDVLAPGVNGYA